MWAHDTLFQHEFPSCFNLDTKLRQWLHSTPPSSPKVQSPWSCWRWTAHWRAGVLWMQSTTGTLKSVRPELEECANIGREASFPPSDALSSAALVSSSPLQWVNLCTFHCCSHGREQGWGAVEGKGLSWHTPHPLHSLTHVAKPTFLNKPFPEEFSMECFPR